MAVNDFQVTNLAATGLQYEFDSSGEFIPTIGKRFAKEFAKPEMAVGQTINITLMPRPNPWIEGREIEPQGTAYDTVSLTVVQKNTSRVLSEAEYVLDAPRFYEDVVKPDVRGGVREADQSALTTVCTGAAMLNTDYIGQEPANSLIWSTTRAKARMMLTPSKGMIGIMNPLAMANLANNESKLFRPAEIVDAAALEGRVQMLGGVGKMFDSVNLPRQENGTANTTGVEVAGTQSPGSSLDIDGCGATKTYKKGQQFWFSDAGVGNALDPEKKTKLPFKMIFTLTEDVETDGGGAATITFTPAIITEGSLQNLESMPLNNADITFAGDPETAYPQSLLYHDEAIQFVGLGLPTLSGQGGVTAVRDYKSVPLRTVKFVDYDTGLQKLRYDLMTGVVTCYPQMVWRHWGPGEEI